MQKNGCWKQDQNQEIGAYGAFTVRAVNLWILMAEIHTSISLSAAGRFLGFFVSATLMKLWNVCDLWRVTRQGHQSWTSMCHELKQLELSWPFVFVFESGRFEATFWHDEEGTHRVQVEHWGLQLSKFNGCDAHCPDITLLVVSSLTFHCCYFRCHPDTKTEDAHVTL